MGRPVILGNGSLTVGLNEQGLVHDFYYPYVGLDNLTTSRSILHKIGLWVDGAFTWVDDGSWNIEVDFEADALVSNVRMHHDQLQIEIVFSDFVDAEVNAFTRRMVIHNQSESYRNVRLFMHQVFQISRAGRADTALFVPDDNYILDYKGRCSLLIYGQSSEGTVYDQFAIGNYGIEGKEGTFKDAEDGELSGSPVEHGGVDSVIRFPVSLAAGASSQIDYWIIAADSQYNAEKVHHSYIDEGVDHRLKTTRDFWKTWLDTGSNILSTVDEEYQVMTKKSLMVVKAHIDKRGGIIASCDSSIYNFGRDYYSYVWPRDGAYAIWPLIRLGFKDEPKKFFEFCRDILTPDGYLMHKYQPDRAIGSTWHPLLHGRRKELAIQEDETAIVIFMLGEYYSHTKDQEFVNSLYNTFIQPAANFLSEFIDEQTKLPHASYDLWEEKFLTSTYTTSCVFQALLVAADFADMFEFPDDAVHWRDSAASIATSTKIFFDPDRKAFRKGFLLQQDGSLEFDNTLDISSLYAVIMFDLKSINDEEVSSTVKVIEDVLADKTPSGGVPRYENDHYFESQPPYLGNPWFVTTLWMAQYHLRKKNLKKAKDYIDWTMKHALHSGSLSEQINPNDGSPLSVTPLVWSHAEYINTVLDVAQVKRLEEKYKT